MKRYAFIYNPAARGGKSQSKLSTLENRLESLQNADLYHSTSQEDISEIIAEQFADYDVFVACGGDGTILEVASNLIQTDKTMGIIPMGSGNDLCKTLKIPVDLEKSLNMLLDAKSTKIDVGQCNDTIFLNILGFGFDGLTNRYSVELKNIYPFFRYAIAALKASVNHDKFRVQISTDGESTVTTKEVIMLSLANGRVEGGAFWVAPNASITDGRLNLVTIRPIQKWLIPILLPLFLIKKPTWISHFESEEINNVNLQFEKPVEIHADGEIIENKSNNYDISLITNGLAVICGL